MATSTLNIAQQMVQDGSLPDMPQAPVPMRAVVTAASTLNPDSEARIQQVAQQSGMAPELARSNPKAAYQAATAADLAERDLERRNPILAAQLQNPDFAGVAHDDLDSLSKIEQGAATLRAADPPPSFLGRAWNEVKSAAANTNTAFFDAFKPVIDAAGVALEAGSETPPALLAGLSGADPGFEGLKDIWVRPNNWAVQQRVTDPIQQWLSQNVIQGPSQYATDPATGQTVKNPAFHWYGRGLVNQVEQVPGALGAFMLLGRAGAAAGEAGQGAEGAGSAADEGADGAGAAKAASAPLEPATAGGIERQLVPAVLGSTSAQNTYADARAKGADIKTAVLAAIDSGLSNYAFMGAMPEAAPAETLAGAAGQFAARSIGLGAGMGISDNAIAQQYDPQRGIFDEVPGSILNMAAFEGGGALAHIASGALGATADAVEASRLRQRSPEAFQSFLDATFEGDERLRIPAQDFVSYFHQKNVDPAKAANDLGITNLAEAAEAGSDLEIPRANFFGKLPTEDVKALLPDVVNPATNMTQREQDGYKDELNEWMKGGGVENLQREFATADAETQSAPEWKQVYDELRSRYVEAGEKESVADSYATLHANAIANLARSAGMTPMELLRMHNPRIVAGDAPGVEGQTLAPAAASPALYQSEISVPGADGKSASVLTPSGSLAGKYKLVEAADLVPSHDPFTFAQNPAYPPGVQERAYDTSKEAQARVIEQSQNYEPAYTVNTNPDAVNGPPVIADNGMVLGGNSRSMSTIRMYRDGDASAYRAALKAHAADFGLSPDDVDRMKEPVLVRQVNTPADKESLRRIGSDLNKSMTGALGSAEQAVSAGKSLRPETLRWAAQTMKDGDLSLRDLMADHGSEVVRHLERDGVITSRERPEFVDAESGGLNDTGKIFVERALLGSVIDEPRLLEAAPKNVLRKLERSLGAIASVATRPDEWNILPAIRSAVGEAASIRSEGTNVEMRLAQKSLFGGERNPVVDALVRSLDGSPKAVTEAFEKFAHDSDLNAPGQTRMFAGADAFESFNHAFGSNITEEGYRHGLEEAAGRSPAVERDADDAEDDGAVSGAAAVRAGGGGKESDGVGRAAGETGGIADTTADAGPVSGPDSQPDAAGEHAANDRVVEGAGAQEKSEPRGKRGWFRMLPDGSFEIGKTKLGDFSTFVHEPAHGYLEMIRELAQRPGASDSLKDDFKTIAEWLGTSPEKAAEEGFSRAEHEKWAEANEQYLREGDAPTGSLKRAFQNFAVWLGSVYRRATALGIPLSPEIRGVMDRIYAADDAINRARAMDGKSSDEPLFKSPEEAGWTDAEYRRYAASKGIAVDDAKAQLIREMHDAWVRARTQEALEAKRSFRDAVTEEIDARREYTAIRSLRRGALDDGTALTLNRDELVRQFGEDRVESLQELHRGLYRSVGGTDAETAAEMLGFGSGEEMLRAIEGAPRRAAAVDAATKQFMALKYGDIRYDGTLEDKALLALRNEEEAKSLYRELGALRRRVTVLQKKAADAKAAMAEIALQPLDQYQEAARQMIADKSVADIQPHRYLNATRMFSREAFDAVRRGDAKKAAEAKNKELLNHFLFREASSARDYVEKFESYTKRVQSKTTQQRLGLAQETSGIDYRDQFNFLLARYKLGTSTRVPESSLREWAEKVYGVGNEPAIAPEILNEKRFGDYRNAPLSEIRQLHDALVNIRHLAMREFKMFVQGKQIEFADAKAAMIASARENLRERPEHVFAENDALADKAAKAPRYLDARLGTMERWVEWLDGGKTGPWHDNVWNLAADAQGDEYGLQHEVTKTVFDALDDMPGDMRRRLWTEKVSVDGVGEPMSRRRMLSVAFNMGNEGNLDRLQKTFVDAGWDPRAIREIGGKLTREEWSFVQKAWDSLKPMGERMRELEQRLTGLPPSMVKVTPFRVALEDGTEMDLEGGYFPIVMDPRFSERGSQQDAKETAQNAMQQGYVRATTSRGYTKERTGYGGPLLLDYEQALTSHVAKVAKDLSHREFMLSTQRLLLDPEVRKTLRETLGPEYEAQFMPWLKAIINDNNGSVQERLDGLKSAMQKLRSNIVVAALSFNPITSLLQVSHTPRMFLYAQPRSLAQSLVDFLARPAQMTQEIRDLSPNEMKFRGDNLDRDLRAVVLDPRYQGGYARRMAEAGRFALSAVDHLFSHTLWMAAYRDALAKYPDASPEAASAKAAHEADSAVRLGLGSQAPKDLPAIMRNNEFNKFITTLYGFHNGVYNQMRDNAHAFRYDRNVVRLTLSTVLTAVLPAAMGAWLTGHGPKDGENVGAWVAKRSLLFAADTVPILRSVASFLDGGDDVQFSPIERILQNGAKTAMDATSDKDDKDWIGIGLNAADFAGEIGGVPGMHEGLKVLRYIHRANQGNVAAPNVLDAITGHP